MHELDPPVHLDCHVLDSGIGCAVYDELSDFHAIYERN